MWNLKNCLSAKKIKTGFIRAERDSVCMADDCMAPNAQELSYDDNMMLSDFMAVISKYVPAMNNCRWIIFFGSEEVAVLTSMSDRKYSYELLVSDRKISGLADKAIYCKYESGRV